MICEVYYSEKHNDIVIFTIDEYGRFLEWDNNKRLEFLGYLYVKNDYKKYNEIRIFPTDYKLIGDL